jgi:hypothetical protein
MLPPAALKGVGQQLATVAQAVLSGHRRCSLELPDTPRPQRELGFRLLWRRLYVIAKCRKLKALDFRKVKQKVSAAGFRAQQ